MRFLPGKPRFRILPFLIAFILAGCIPATPTPTTSPPPQAGMNCGEIARVEEPRVGEFFILGQVILSGPASAIDAVIQQASDELGLEFEAAVDCTLPYLNTDPSEGRQTSSRPDIKVKARASIDARILPAFQGQDIAPALRLYFFDPAVAVENVVQAINRLGNADGVYADPNYLIGHLAKSPCSNPFSVEGSPFSVEGSPFAVEGSPGAGPGLDADPAGFWSQWAFKVLGVGDYRPISINVTGARVRVAVFDTSPFEETGQMVIDVVEPPLILDVQHPALINGLTITNANPFSVEGSPFSVEGSPLGTDLLKDHGLFVAGLIHGVATQSQISLIRVLNDDGCGDLMSMVIAVHQFAADTLQAQGSLERSVFNFSLGVKQPRDANARGLPEEIFALQRVVLDGIRRGAVVVAAAGNDSVADIMRLPAELPAAYDQVLGVAGSTIENGPACFSNRGDVAAPAGDAQVGQFPSQEEHEQEESLSCLPQTADCPAYDLETGAPGQCPWGVISLSLASKSGYSYWAGTSFSTPLASGLAALLWEQTASQSAVIATLTDTSLMESLSAGTDPGFASGILSAAKSLTP